MDKNIAPKLIQLSEMQEVDTRLSELVKLRGTLPEEVDELKQDIAQLRVKIADAEGLLSTLQEDIVDKKTFVKHTEKIIQQYESQQMEVRNNREYDAIIQELKLHELDIQLSEKFLRTAYIKVEEEQVALEALHKLLKLKESDLLVKEQELELILKESKAEEQVLYKRRQDIVAALGASLYTTYERIVKSVQNNLGVVSIKKGACGGCCIVIPPQQKLEVYERSKIVFCEYCGRMLIAPEQPADSLLFVS